MHNVYLCSYCGGKSQQNPAREGALLCEHCGAAFGKGDRLPAARTAGRAAPESLPPSPSEDPRRKRRHTKHNQRSWWYRLRKLSNKAEDAVDDLEDIVDDIFD